MCDRKTVWGSHQRGRFVKSAYVLKGLQVSRSVTGPYSKKGFFERRKKKNPQRSTHCSLSVCVYYVWHSLDDSHSPSQ